MQLQAPALQLELAAKQTADAEGWCRVWLSASTPVFQGDYEGWLQLTDLQRFIEELDAMQFNVGKECTATLSSAEPDIQLELRMRVLGGISGIYALRPSCEPSRGYVLTL